MENFMFCAVWWQHRALALFKISRNHKDALILCHINRCSVSKNIEELENLLDKKN